MEFGPGTYRTVDDRKAVILHRLVGDTKYPLIGYIEDPDGSQQNITWTSDGKFDVNKSHTGMDLALPVRKQTMVVCLDDNDYFYIADCNDPNEIGVLKISYNDNQIIKVELT